MTWVEEKVNSSPESLRLFLREYFATLIGELICERMEQEGVSYAELARRMGVKKKRVRRMLADTTAATIGDVADAFLALGVTPRIVVDDALQKMPMTGDYVMPWDVPEEPSDG